MFTEPREITSRGFLRDGTVFVLALPEIQNV